MKKYLQYLLSLAYVFMTASGFATDSNNTSLNTTREWIQARPVRFTENKGQITDMDGKLVPFVLFKAEAPGINMYITEKGLTYVFIKAEEAFDKLRETDSSHSKLFNLSDMSEGEENKEIAWNRIDMDLAGATIKKENIVKEGISTDYSQYFLAHCPEGITNVRSYEKITIKEVYPKIDWIFYNSSDKGFKYDFIVHPGADPKQIELIYSSLNPLKLDKEGNISIKTEIDGALTEDAPFSYIEESKEEVPSSFQIISQGIIDLDEREHYQTRVAFNLKSKFTNLKNTLIIDPQLWWATFLEGNNHDGPQGITTDNTGNLFVTGYTWSSVDFPIQNAFQGNYGGDLSDAFILKFSNSGNLLWSTYYGGNKVEYGNSITIDANNNVFVAGETSSVNFPLLNEFQLYNGRSDAFILKFDNDGNRLWATYYGGNGWDEARSIDIDNTGNIYITGKTTSTNLSVRNAFQQTLRGPTDIFIIKFDNVGSQLWATYFGGSLEDFSNTIAVDNSSRSVFVAGYTNSTDLPFQDAGTGTISQQFYGGGTLDAFILRFDWNGTRLFSSYYGGSEMDLAYSMGADHNGNLFILGNTTSIDLSLQDGDSGSFFQPALTGGRDAFVLKLENTGKLLWGTYYGGADDESSRTYDNITIDACGAVHMSFETMSTDISTQPSCEGGYNVNTHSGGIKDILLTKFSNSGALLWSTYWGGSGNDFRSPLAVDNTGNLFVAGEWTQRDNTTIADSTYPIINPGGGTYNDNTYNGEDDIFIAKFKSTPVPVTISTSTTPSPSICDCSGTAIVNATGSCGSYFYTWYDSSWIQIGKGDTITSICPGNYQIIVKGISSCSIDSAWVTVAGPSPLEINSTTSSVSCYNYNDGNAAIFVAGGTPPYTYSWEPVGGTDSTASDLSPDTYTVTVTDFNGCVKTHSIVVTEPAPLSTNVSSSYIICYDKKDCIATVIVAGGTPPYSYLWTPDAGTNATATDLSTNTYTVSVTDANGCNTTDTVTVIFDECMQLMIPNVFSPNGDGLNDFFGIECLQLKDKAEIFNRWGNLILELSVDKNKWDGKNINGEECSDGVYYYLIFSDKIIENTRGYIHLFR